MKIYDNLSPLDQRLWIKTQNEITILRGEQTPTSPKQEEKLREQIKIHRALVAKAELKL